MQHPWPSTNHYRRTLENQSPTSFEPGTLRNTWFRRQRINDSRLKHKYLHLRRQKTTKQVKQTQKTPEHKKYAQTTHKNLINLGEDTRTPTINTPRQQYERQPTHTIESPHPNRKIYSVGILESRSTKIVLLSICIRTRVRTWKKRERTARRPQEWKRE